MKVKSFKEFYPYYLSEHSKPGTKLLHFIGSWCGLVCLGELTLTGNFWWVPTGFLLGYGFAWTGHFFIEKNKPATFQYPLYSFMGDWMMFSQLISRKLRFSSN
jgi:hypothetical protein